MPFSGKNTPKQVTFGLGLSHSKPFNIVEILGKFYLLFVKYLINSSLIPIVKIVVKIVVKIIVKSIIDSDDHV